MATRPRRGWGGAAPGRGGRRHAVASETDDTDAEAVRTLAATAASDALEDERNVTCDFFDTRQGFLRMCQGNNYQFDTLRRAKHSSMMILWHLHNPSIPAYAHACNVCETDIGCGTRWHCEACYDYDICDACHAASAARAASMAFRKARVSGESWSVCRTHRADDTNARAGCADAQPSRTCGNRGGFCELH